MVQSHPKVKMLMDKANEFLGVIGYTEHGNRHGKVVAKTAGNILESLGDDERIRELTTIAGYLHDIGNVINRDHHAQSGALIAGQILEELEMPFEESIEVIGAIGNHHEEDGTPVSRITAALILADKADVHRSRVRTTRTLKTDIHDRVNYAATKSIVKVDSGNGITLEVKVDNRIASVMEYFEIFMERMLISKKAANFLGREFHLDINGNHLL
ncbi:phosphohydrolase [candidate division LCP-89 bacterium B3_LCP]|uniref:Phosphohydrolase n=1 Tax=candidate division LCP-89 bacterium B3_LCP TaxID=2012998 RepID=A0A532UYR0_UNCL8|nr:MAG: phosphohydrolase [candidate division LCP-89 bacterium B3_LCP]